MISIKCIFKFANLKLICQMEMEMDFPRGPFPSSQMEMDFPRGF